MPNKVFNLKRSTINKILNFLMVPVFMGSVFFWLGYASYLGASGIHSSFYFIASSWALPIAIAFTVFFIALIAFNACEHYYPINFLEEQDSSSTESFLKRSDEALRKSGRSPENLAQIIIQSSHPDIPIIYDTASPPYIGGGKPPIRTLSEPPIYAVKHKRQKTDLTDSQESTPPDEIRLPNDGAPERPKF